MVLLAEDQREVRVSWEEEPGEYSFALSRHSKSVRVRVLAFDDASPPQPDEVGREVFNATCSFDALLDAVIAGARRVLSEWGVAGHRERWVDHDFPLPDLEIARACRRAPRLKHRHEGRDFRRRALEPQDELQRRI